ncbi:hypothetical protein [Lysinibacillus odysseyi]|uniref:Uncharacterized protein n=1 Tax=Lysinibacillus odysseyi 34hs-1 = NBRC 100172 TaxID=1220589 RepID=A0A0A3J778_9BACI|nr:hypothetical protein [Lysinibacillus odysseyi]KGR82902.1 hypothetical protein CD32_18900 [Lysinibacillus odysseyi 34hs-1 = NBRC 100172]
MFVNIKKVDSLFLINDTVLDRFNSLRKELELITLSIPSTFNRFQVWNLFVDFWVKSAFTEDDLIEHPHHSLIYIVRKTLIHEAFQLQAVQRVLPLTYKNDRFAYLFSLYTLIELDNFFTSKTRLDDEYASYYNDLMVYASKDISSYFDESFQTLETYPKLLAVTQAKVFKKITEITAKSQSELNEAVENAVKAAKDMYYLLYDAFI